MTNATLINKLISEAKQMLKEANNLNKRLAHINRMEKFKKLNKKNAIKYRNSVKSLMKAF